MVRKLLAGMLLCLDSSSLIFGQEDSKLIRPNVILSVVDDPGGRDWEICDGALHLAPSIGRFVSKATPSADAYPAPILSSVKGADNANRLPPQSIPWTPS